MSDERTQSPALLAALAVVNQLGLDLGVTYSKTFELKGYCHDAEDGGRCKFYLIQEEVQELADAFKTIADEAKAWNEKEPRT